MSKQIRQWLLIILLIPTMATASQSNYFQAGVQAFQEGKYEEAVSYFQQASKEGEDKPQLNYNLGAAYFKTGQYERSEGEFKKLAYLPEWQALALYNLGLIAEITEDRESAIAYYSGALNAAAENSAIAQRAELKLRELEADMVKHAAARQWYFLLSASLGYDDNVTLVPDNTLTGVSRGDDIFADFYILAGDYLRGGYEDGIRVDAGAYARIYAEEKEFNYTTLFLEISRYRQYGPWHTRAGVSLNTDFIEDQFYAAIPGLKVSLERSAYNTRIRLTNILNWVEADDEYRFVTGLRNRTALELSRPIYSGIISTGYEFEYNDRRDFKEEDLFYSYSPLRHRVFAKLDYPVTTNWNIALLGEFRRSVYPENNIFFYPDESRRRDDRLIFSVRGEYRITKSMDLFAEFSHTDNDSNYPPYAYTSNQIMLGWQMLIY